MINDKARRSVIQFEDVSFEYPGAETESIHHISLDIKKGESHCWDAAYRNILCMKSGKK